VLVGAFVAAAIVAVFASSRDVPAPQPPAARGLLTWEPRGELATDSPLIKRALGVWRAGDLVDGASAPVPADEAYVLWAGTIGAGRVVLLQGLAADGTPYVAQLSEHGDPPLMGLDVVEEVPPGEPVVIAVTYDGIRAVGNLLTPGAVLVQLLAAPSPEGDVRTVWAQPGLVEGFRIRPLDVGPDGMSEAFVREGAGIELFVAETLGGRAGIAEMVNTVPGELFPVRTVGVVVRDGPFWGPSGRIDGGEHLDAFHAANRIVDADPDETYAAADPGTTIDAEVVAANPVVVHEVAFGSKEVDGATITARLLEVDPTTGSKQLVLVAWRFATSNRAGLVCLSWDGSGGSTPLAVGTEDARRLVALRCVAPERDLLVTAVAAPDGVGPVELTGSSPAAEGATGRLVAIGRLSEAARTPVVASLVTDPTVSIKLPSLAEVQ